MKDYVGAFESYSDPDTLREALKLTVPGSTAYAYMSHQANLAEAALDGGSPYSDQTNDKLGEGKYRSCQDPADEKSCVTFSDFKVDASGKLVDLKVDNKSLKGRLTVGNGGKVSSGGSKFTFLTAYKSIQSNALFVTVKIESGSKKISPNIYSATYRSPEGKQREATDALGPVDLDAKSNAIVGMVFAGVQPGGKVTLDGCVGDCTAQFRAVVKVG